MQNRRQKSHMWRNKRTERNCEGCTNRASATRGCAKRVKRCRMSSCRSQNPVGGNSRHWERGTITARQIRIFLLADEGRCDEQQSNQAEIEHVDSDREPVHKQLQHLLERHGLGDYDTVPQSLQGQVRDTYRRDRRERDSPANRE